LLYEHVVSYNRWGKETTLLLFENPDVLVFKNRKLKAEITLFF